MDIYSLILPLLRKIDAETAHNVAIHALSSGMVPPARKRNYPQLSQKLWGLHFANPVGLAPGFDKNAQAWNATLKQGFGFIELGTVTPQPQQGNAKPRMFRLEEDSAVINRYAWIC